MSFAEFLKRVGGELDCMQVISSFLTNFSNIHGVEDLDPEVRSKIVDITNAPERAIIRAAEGVCPGHVPYSFVFEEDNTFNGVLDLDFIYARLANVRVQLFAVGMGSSGKMSKRYGEVLKFATKRFGEAQDDADFDRLIWRNSNLIITLRGLLFIPGGSPYFSFTVTDKEFA